MIHRVKFTKRLLDFSKFNVTLIKYRACKKSEELSELKFNVLSVKYIQK